MRRHGQVNVIIYYPKSEKGKDDLARHVSYVHASAVNQRLKSLDCPTQQKLDLLEAVIKTAKARSKEQA